MMLKNFWVSFDDWFTRFANRLRPSVHRQRPSPPVIVIDAVGVRRELPDGEREAVARPVNR